ncbi:unnamed protein product [Gordionus sp. m RMFG-2023]|uniref:corticotropin-releasing factor receptor 1-like n=1 Tax=Gordionus sp. m RMFG-2023 TaxID=3053472 RepID=UPI0030E529EC
MMENPEIYCPFLVNDESLTNTGLFCNATWDSFYCWPTTPAGTTIYKPCPVSHFTHKDARAFRVCELDGRWARNGWTNYSACLGCLDPQSPFYGACQTTKDDEQHQRITRIIRDITFFGSIISLAFLSIAFAIFTHFRTLRCIRISIHKHLVLAFIFRSLMTIAIAEPAVMKRVISYRQIEWLCKLIISINIYGTLASIAWMFNEGLYLHSRIVTSVFTSDNIPFWIFHCIGWVLPLFFMALWAILINKSNHGHCWKNYSSSQFIWIIGVPMILALTINLFFLVNIIRILVLKLKASNLVESTNMKKTVKATIILFPLLGITNLLFFFNPKDQKILENMYLLVNALLQNSQGIFVSVLYCFLNGEVKGVIYKKYKNYRLSQIHSIKYKRSTSNLYSQNNMLPQNESSLMNAENLHEPIRGTAVTEGSDRAKKISNTLSVNGKYPPTNQSQIWVRSSVSNRVTGKLPNILRNFKNKTRFKRDPLNFKLVLDSRDSNALAKNYRCVPQIKIDQCKNDSSDINARPLKDHDENYTTSMSNEKKPFLEPLAPAKIYLRIKPKSKNLKKLSKSDQLLYTDKP